MGAASKIFEQETLVRRVVALAIVVLAGFMIWLGSLWGLSKSDWAAWVQAVGSVAAVFVAVWIVRLQHQRDVRLRDESERGIRRRQLSALRWVFSAASNTCETVAARVHSEHTTWTLQAELLAEQRRLFSSIGLSELPDAALVLRIHEFTQLLQHAHTVVEALAQPRKESIRNHVAELLRDARDIALAGVTECTKLLIACSTQVELDADWQLLDARKGTMALTKRVYAELQITEESAQASQKNRKVPGPDEPRL